LIHISYIIEPNPTLGHAWWELSEINLPVGAGERQAIAVACHLPCADNGTDTNKFI